MMDDKRLFLLEFASLGFSIRQLAIEVHLKGRNAIVFGIWSHGIGAYPSQKLEASFVNDDMASGAFDLVTRL